MYSIWQLIMIAVYFTGRLKYTLYRGFFHFLNKELCYFWKVIRILYTGWAKWGDFFYLLQLPSNVALMDFDKIPFVLLYIAQTVLLVTWWSTGRLLQYDIEHWNCWRNLRRAVNNQTWSQFTVSVHTLFSKKIFVYSDVTHTHKQPQKQNLTLFTQ